MRERLFREARSAGILSHPGIVTIYDVEQQGDLAYIAMEYVDGPTLDQVLSESAADLRRRSMFSILAQTAAALDYAHQGHRAPRHQARQHHDLRRTAPSKITDFGIAKITAAEQLTMTGHDRGHAALHVAGAGAGPAGGWAQRPVLAGRDRVRNADRRKAVYRRASDHGGLQDRGRGTGAAASPQSEPRRAPSRPSLRKALAKKPDARYRNCQEFVDAMEKACSATKGWKAMARGGT